MWKFFIQALLENLVLQLLKGAKGDKILGGKAVVTEANENTGRAAMRFNLGKTAKYKLTLEKM